MLTPIHVICNGDTKVFCRLNIFQSLIVYCVQSKKNCLWCWCRVTLIEWHLATLNFICQSASHCPKLVRSSCKVKQSWSECIFLYRTQSSANRRTEDLMLSGRSFMKRRNRTGPKTDPWGTPDSTGTGSEAWPSKTTCWVRPESHELIHLWVDPLIP